MMRFKKRYAAAVSALCLGALACGPVFAEEAQEPAPIVCNIEDGSYVIHIPDPTGDPGWIADDMAQDDSVVRLAEAEMKDDEFFVRYEPVGDGEITVSVRHYTGIACDRLHTFDLTVKDGAVTESPGGSFTASPEEEDLDSFLSGEWLEADTQFTQMTVEKNEERGWNVEIVSPLTQEAFVFKTTIYFDCDLNSFVYDKGKFWDLPTDAEENAPLGEAKTAGTSGAFTLAGDEDNLLLDWYDGERPEKTITFAPVKETVDYGTSELYTREDMEKALVLIDAEFGTWEGCRMNSIRYAGDECMNEDNLKWMNDLGEEKGYTQCIEFLSEFHSPVEGGGAWEPDTDYHDYQWWLARQEGGDWELLTWGY